MRITIVLTDENGKKYEGSVTLSPVSESRESRQIQKRPASSRHSALSFDHNARAFMKRYGRDLSGPQKFTLLLARLAKGDVTRQVALAELEKHWNSMKSLMDGPFNRAHSNRAKDNGWVDSPERGIYVLTPSWKEAVNVGKN